MNKAFSKILIILGVLLFLIAIGLFVYSRVDNYLAGQRAQRLLEQVLSDGWDTVVLTEPSVRPTSQGFSASALESSDNESANTPVMGDGVIGILEIPKLEITLPVLDGSSDAQLKISVGRFTGSIEEKPDRLVIAGHNYRSHFGEISSLTAGDIVLFTMRDGVTLSYSVIRIESCNMYDVDAVQTGDDWNMTLLTCQRNRDMRTLVRLVEIADN